MTTNPRAALAMTLLATLFWGANFSAGKIMKNTLLQDAATCGCPTEEGNVPR